MNQTRLVSHHPPGQSTSLCLRPFSQNGSRYICKDVHDRIATSFPLFLIIHRRASLAVISTGTEVLSCCCGAGSSVSISQSVHLTTADAPHLASLAYAECTDHTHQ